MPGVLTELGVAGKPLLRTMGRRLRSQIEAAPDLDRIRQGDTTPQDWSHPPPG